jgi:hypothetical protein
MAFIVAVHDVSDPKRWWGGAAEAGDPPEGVTLHSTYPRKDGARATCLWEADSVNAVREYVDAFGGDASHNDYFEVDEKHDFALGLPAHAASGAQ